MIVEIGGGSGGLKDYLENGQKKGRELHRDQLDQRIPLFGDLDLFEKSTSFYETEGKRYDHITLGFSENHVSDEMLKAAVDEFREHAMAAWTESERHRIAFYAEAHRPKILSYTNSATGEEVERLTHIHIGIGRRDLETGESVEVLGFLGENTENLKYVDAFQEYFNAKYGFSSPKDNPKITPENAIDTLARYSGQKPDKLGSFNQKKASLEITLQKEILAKNITSWDEFGKLLATHGEVSKMHEGKFNECYRVTPEGERGMRLKGVFFQREFIERSTADKTAIISRKAKVAYLEQMQPKKEPAYVEKNIREWQEIKAREIRYIHKSSKFYKEIYKPADAEMRRQLLDEIERKNHAISSPVPDSRHGKITPTRNRVPGLPKRDLDGIQKRSEMLLRDHDGLDVRARSGGEQDSLGLRQADDSRHSDGVAIDAGTGSDQANFGADGTGRTGNFTNRSGVRKFDGGSGSGDTGETKRAGYVLRHQPSSVIARFESELRERYEQAEDKERYAEIRKNLDCTQLLNSLSHSHGLNPVLYQVSVAKDGAPRIQCGSRALTPSDFLTKELGLPWKEATPILRKTYELQINSKIIKPRAGKSSPSHLWKEFKAAQQADEPAVTQRLKVFDGIAKARKSTLTERLKAEQKSALSGLSGSARQAASSIQKMNMAIAKAELDAMIKEERQALRSSIQLPQAQAWRLFLQTRAQAGNDDALTELRKLDNTARVAQESVPGIIGTIIIEDEEEKKRRIRTRNGFALIILKELAQNQIIESNGDSTYHLHGHPVLRDQGNHLAVLDEHSEAAIAAGLLLGREKFGNTLTVTGSPEFQRRLVTVAVAQGIALKFADPDLEAMRVQLIADKRHATQTIRKPALKQKPEENIMATDKDHELVKQSLEETKAVDKVLIEQARARQTSSERAALLSRETGKAVSASSPGRGTILDITSDGIVIDKGLTIAPYRTNTVDFKVGQKVVVGKNGAIELALEKEKDNDLGR